jgi:hypothetical protein
MFVLAATIVGGRIWHRLDQTTPPFAIESALVDFRDAVYYPVVATLDGENPYDAARVHARYPVNGTIGLYSPLTLLLHCHRACCRIARRARFVLSLGRARAVLAAAWRIAAAPWPRASCSARGVLVITRPGHWNLFSGRSRSRRRSRRSRRSGGARRGRSAAARLRVATFKPTYGLPLLALLAARAMARARRRARAAACSRHPARVDRRAYGAGGFVPTLSPTTRRASGRPA